MQIIPALDILEGKVVRLTRGDYGRVKWWGADPVDLARAFERRGARRLHLVDLEGARSGVHGCGPLLERMAATTHLEIQVGGGVRTLDGMRRLLDRGARRVVVGTLFFSRPEALEEAGLLLGRGRLVVALDMKEGEARIEGWRRSSGLELRQCLERVRHLGLEEVLLTAIERDGMESGPDLDLYRRAVADAGSLRVMASGGVGGREDLDALARIGCRGAVVGRALLEGTFDLEEWADPPQAPRAAATAGRPAVRVIACLDVRSGRVVKGTRFSRMRDAGDPVELARRYCRQGADELVLLDIAASSQGRRTLLELVEKVARAVDVPLTVGGGVRSVEEARRLLQSGADKVSVNTAALQCPRLLSRMAEVLGSANTVCALDVRRRGRRWRALAEGGRRDTGRDAIVWARQAVRRGAGELLLTSWDRDGTSTGFDLPLLREVRGAVQVPIIASGGAGSPRHFVRAVREGGADALLAAGTFHFGTLTVGQVKRALAAASIPVRS